MWFLKIIGIPFRLFLYLAMHAVIGVFEPEALGGISEDWTWVWTGVDKRRRNNGRQLI